MADWELAPCLVTLFHEYNIIAPLRDHTTDGSIGDPAHQQRDSDHNKDKNGIVHAIDVDKDLYTPFSMESTIQYFVTECRKSVGLDRGRLKYFIYNHRIWEAPNWVQKPYTGSNPHTEHAHFSCEYDPKYANDTRPWGLTDKFGKDDIMDQAEFNTLLVGAFKDPAVAASFGAMYLDKISTTDYADTVNNPKRLLTLRQNFGYVEGRGQVEDVHKSVEIVSDQVVHLAGQIKNFGDLLQAHVSGVIEGNS